MVGVPKARGQCTACSPLPLPPGPPALRDLVAVESGLVGGGQARALSSCSPGGRHSGPGGPWPGLGVSLGQSRALPECQEAGPRPQLRAQSCFSWKRHSLLSENKQLCCGVYVPTPGDPCPPLACTGKAGPGGTRVCMCTHLCVCVCVEVQRASPWHCQPEGLGWVGYRRPSRAGAPREPLCSRGG